MIDHNLKFVPQIFLVYLLRLAHCVAWNSTTQAAFFTQVLGLKVLHHYAASVGLVLKINSFTEF